MIKKTDGKSKDELERAASHVLYELNMLCDAIELYNKNMTDEKLKNCFFVTLCVHARSVINFISPSHWNGSSVRPDDILAKHFLEESESKLLEFELTELSKTEPLIKNPLFRDRINKGIAHLSYKRLEEASLEIFFISTPWFFSRC